MFQIVDVQKDSMMIINNQIVYLVPINVSLVSELQISVPGVSVSEKTHHLVLTVQLVCTLMKKNLIVNNVPLNVLPVRDLKLNVSNVLNIDMMMHQYVLKIVSLFIVNVNIKEKNSKSVKMIPTSTMEMEYGKNQSDQFTSLKD